MNNWSRHEADGQRAYDEGRRADTIEGQMHKEALERYRSFGTAIVPSDGGLSSTPSAPGGDGGPMLGVLGALIFGLPLLMPAGKAGLEIAHRVGGGETSLLAIGAGIVAFAVVLFVCAAAFAAPPRWAWALIGAAVAPGAMWMSGRLDGFSRGGLIASVIALGLGGALWAGGLAFCCRYVMPGFGRDQIFERYSGRSRVLLAPAFAIAAVLAMAPLGASAKYDNPVMPIAVTVVFGLAALGLIPYLAGFLKRGFVLSLLVAAPVQLALLTVACIGPVLFVLKDEFAAGRMTIPSNDMLALPKLALGTSVKVWVVCAVITCAIAGLSLRDGEKRP